MIFIGSGLALYPERLLPRHDIISLKQAADARPSAVSNWQKSEIQPLPTERTYGSWDAARKKAGLESLSIHGLRRNIKTTW